MTRIEYIKQRRRTARRIVTELALGELMTGFVVVCIGAESNSVALGALGVLIAAFAAATLWTKGK